MSAPPRRSPPPPSPQKKEFLYLQDNVVVQDVERVVQRVNGEVCWPLQTHLQKDIRAQTHAAAVFSIKGEKKKESSEEASMETAHKSQLQVLQIISP